MFDSIWEDIKHTFNQSKNIIPKLILINVLVFVALNGMGLSLTHFMGRIFGFDADGVLKFFSLPVQLHTLSLQPWSILTYGFLHEDILHILFNMLFLYYLGSILQEYLGNRKVLTAFLGGIIAGGLIEVLAYQGMRFSLGIYPGNYTIGASGGVMAVMAGAATLLPDYEIQFIFFRIRLKYVFLFYFMMDVLSLASSSNWGGHVAHVAGAIFGYLYIRDLYRKAFVDRLVDTVNGWFRQKPKMKVTYKSKTYTTAANKSAHYRNRRPDQNEVDAILDKISQSGYDSLTKSEKEILFAASHEE
jgi:membrane associated rhomboid family serine protease